MRRAAHAGLAVLSIDMQVEYFREGGPLRVPRGEAVLQTVRRLLCAARSRGVPVVHVRHVSSDPLDATFASGSPGVAFVEEAAPTGDERIITKSLPGAFHATHPDQVLHEATVHTVLVCGLLSFMCCDTTARGRHRSRRSVRGAGLAILDGDHCGGSSWPARRGMRGALARTTPGHIGGRREACAPRNGLPGLN